MDIHEKNEYSGFESSLPKRIVPYLLKAKNIRNIKNRETLKIKNQLISLNIRLLNKLNIERVLLGNIAEITLSPIIIDKEGMAILGLRVVFLSIYFIYLLNFYYPFFAKAEF